MFRTENALILREVRFRESDRILTAMTPGLGKVTLAAHGALSKKSRIAAGTQQLTWSELTLFEKDGRRELENLALGSYIAECLELFSTEGQPEPELLQLGLNSLYALSEGLAPREKIKAAFELRLTAMEGYAPAVEVCAVCGRKEIRSPVFLQDDGVAVCRDCLREERRFLPFTSGALEAMRQVLQAPPKRFLSFGLDGEDLARLSSVSEAWLLHCAGREIPSLEYYKKL